MEAGSAPTWPRAVRSRYVVAVGASAGGMESLGRLLEELPSTFAAPMLVTLHLDPNHQSHAVEILQKRTQLDVRGATDGVVPEPGTVYVAPPDRHLVLRDRRLLLTDTAPVNFSRPSLDALFESLAREAGRNAIAVVLSGTGRDGTAGTAAVKAHGGLVVVEDGSTAKYTGMPNAAAHSGAVDAVLPVDEIPEFLLRAIGRRVRVSEQQWQSLLASLKAKTGTDFGCYRATTLHRRLQLRLAALGCKSMEAYLLHMAADPEEAQRLQGMFLIKVSSFNRDPKYWARLSSEIVRLDRENPGGLRVWSVGCATGEEAYSLAILLARLLGMGPESDWRVYATDLDETALAHARAARYTVEQLLEIPPADLGDFFVRDGNLMRVDNALRSRVVFGQHDLTRDPPLTRIDVVVCRNVLIYFTRDVQKAALKRLAAAVNPGGVLFLGQAEALGPIPGFNQLDATNLFRRSQGPAQVPKRDDEDARGADAPADETESPDVTWVATIEVDRRGRVRLWDHQAAAIFGVDADAAVGKPLSTSVGRRAARRFMALAAHPAGTRSTPIECDTDAGRRLVGVTLLPGEAGAGRFACVPAGAAPDASFLKGPSLFARLARPRTGRLMRAQQYLNEELQSRNEELETVNEELQSLNDEMVSMEDQMRDMAEASERTNDFLRLLLDASPDALVACDLDDRVLFWSRTSTKRFRLSLQQAVGGDLFELVPALDEPSIREAARKVRTSGEGGEIHVVHEGEEYRFTPLVSQAGKHQGYLLRVVQATRGAGASTSGDDSS